jgi:hypothetical protein
MSGPAIPAAPGRVSAQPVDYGAPEQLYGEPVTTSASGTPQKESEAPAVMPDLKFKPYYEISRDIISMMAFYKDQIVVNGVSYPPVTNMNVGNDSGWGLEIQLKGSSSGGSCWDASYSFSRVADKGLVQPNINFEGSEASHHVRLPLGYTYGPWEFDAEGMYVKSSAMLHSPDGGDDDAPVPVSGYFSVGNQIGYKINDHLTVSLSGTNLNTHTIVASPYPQIERQVFLTVTAHL